MMIEEAGVPRRLLVWSQELTSHQSHICLAQIRAEDDDDDKDDDYAEIMMMIILPDSDD